MKTVYLNRISSEKFHEVWYIPLKYYDEFKSPSSCWLGGWLTGALVFRNYIRTWKPV